MRINHNISSMITQSSLFKTNRAVAKNLEKLSTGLRINRSADDAAGLGVSENLRTQVRGIHQASKNNQDIISMLHIAEGALNEMSEILQRMRELVLQAKNDTYSDTEVIYMGNEFEDLGNELDRIANTTNFNGMTIFANQNTVDQATGDPKSAQIATSTWLNGADAVFGENDDASATHFNMMVGQNYSAADALAFNNGTSLNAYDTTAANFITIQMGQMDLEGLFNKDVQTTTNGWRVLTGMGNSAANMFTASLNWEINAWGDSQTKLNLILELIDGDPISGSFSRPITNFTNGSNYTGIERVNKMRSYIGAIINRLEHNLNNLMEQEASQQAAESVIRDADFAKETASYTKNQILTQSGTSMLAHANVQSQSILQLLR